MKISHVSGDKNVFGIEVAESKYPNKFYLRFWISNLPMGLFKKAADVKFAIDTFQKILKNKEVMYLPEFEGKTPMEINDYTKINHDNPKDFKKLERLVPLYKLAFFGKQFTDSQSEYLLLYKDGIFQLIWKNDFNAPLYEGKVSLEEFTKTFNDFISYCSSKGYISTTSEM
jgi:hypothetical protein